MIYSQHKSTTNTIPNKTGNIQTTIRNTEKTEKSSGHSIDKVDIPSTQNSYILYRVDIPWTFPIHPQPQMMQKSNARTKHKYHAIHIDAEHTPFHRHKQSVLPPRGPDIHSIFIFFFCLQNRSPHRELFSSSESSQCATTWNCGLVRHRRTSTVHTKHSTANSATRATAYSGPGNTTLTSKSLF